MLSHLPVPTAYSEVELRKMLAFGELFRSGTLHVYLVA